MPRHQQLTDDVRTLLQADDQRLTDEMRRLAAGYADACRSTNERLRRCMDLVNRGLRTEAVQLAETEPPVTDLVNELDLAELQPAWDELCSLYDLPRAEPLRLELAEAIHEAYAELEPLNALLTRHRKLALARAPLPARIGVLRELVTADVQSPFWEDDLRAYERARLREVEAEARVAAQDRNVAHLQSLLAEITSADWREPPTPDLQRKVKAFAGQIQRGSARDELEQIEPALQTAFTALDLVLGRHFRERWDDAARRAKLAAADPLSERVAPVLGWLSDEDAREEQERSFRTAVADLESTIDRDETDLAELERKAHAAARFDRELPGPLVIAYRNRRAALEAGEKRRRFAIAGGAGIALLLVIGFVGLLLWRAGLDRKVEQLAGEVTGLVEAGKLAEARRLFDESRDISAKDDWLDVRRLLEDAERAESDRAAALIAAVEAASAAEDFDEASPHLATAREKAVTQDEKLEVARLERSWQERRDDTFRVNEGQFRTAAAAAADVLARLDRSVASADVAGVDKLLGQAETAVGSLLVLTSGVRPDVAREQQVLAARLAALRSTVGERADRERLFAQMTAALANDGDPTTTIDRYVAAIEAYRKRFPQDPRSAEFAEAVGEADLWRAAVRWESLCDDWQAARPRDTEVSRRLALVEGYLAAHEARPSATLAAEYSDFLRSLSQRSGDEGIDARLTDLFHAPLIGGPLHVVRTRDGRSYYLRASADFTNSLAAPFSYLIGTDPSRDMKSTLLKKSELTSRTSEPAPQVTLADGVLKNLSRTTIESWDRYLLELSKAVLQAGEMDAFVQHLLLVELLTAAADGNSLLAAPVADLVSRLEDDAIDPAARWMDPDDKDAGLSRQRAAAAIRRVTTADLDAAWRAASEAETSLTEQLRQPYRLIGWLRREGNRWECAAAEPLSDPLSVSVAVPDTEGSPWQSVGTVSADASSLRGPELKQGRLLFARGGSRSGNAPTQLGASR